MQADYITKRTREDFTNTTGDLLVAYSLQQGKVWTKIIDTINALPEDAWAIERSDITHGNFSKTVYRFYSVAGDKNYNTTDELEMLLQYAKQFMLDYMTE